jgi:cell division septal protein FtsQ
VSRVRGVAMAAGVLVLGTAPWWGPSLLRRFSFFAVRRVEVVGARYLAPARVVAAMGLKVDASVWTSLATLERRVAAMPGVEAVKISRRLPSALRVEVTEVAPVALAAGPSGLVPLGRDGRPLPYDPARTPVDAPVVRHADAQVLEALEVVRVSDPGLFAAVTTARVERAGGGEVVLELERGRLRLGTPVDPAVVRAVAAVARDLEQVGRPWRELDGRFKGWVVVRPALAGGARAGPARAA